MGISIFISSKSKRGLSEPKHVDYLAQNSDSKRDNFKFVDSKLEMGGGQIRCPS